MAILIDQSGDAFFKGRAWLARGLRYPELDSLEGDGELFDICDACDAKSVLRAGSHGQAFS